MQPTRRESLFLSSSLSRGTSLTRNGSHESLSAHPLLSPTPSIIQPASSSSSVDSHNSASPSNSNETPPRYVPYTPRQRVAPTSVTTGTTMHPNINSAPQQHSFQGDATSKLQLMNLKAAAQRIGLDINSAGWAILERLSEETDHGPEWNEIWNALSVGKATLLLPLEPHSHHDPITPEFLKDHIALCDDTVRTSSPIVTLSGLRGSLANDTLTLRSALQPASKPFQALLSPSTRTSALSALPPLPLPLEPPSPTPSSPASVTGASYPTYTISLHPAPLPLPPRPQAIAKPPLPPRPGTRVVSAPHGPPQPAVQTHGSRLSNPFASFFARATPPASPTMSTSSLQPESTPLGPLPSVSSGPTLHQGAVSPAQASGSGSASDGASEHALGVPVYTISARIDRTQVAPALARALTKELHAALADAGVPEYAAERVENFVGPLFPLVRAGPEAEKDAVTKSAPRIANGAAKGAGAGGRRNREGLWVVVPAAPGADETAARFQEFYVELEDLVRERLKEHGHGHEHLHGVLRKGHFHDVHTEESSGTGSGSGSGSAEETDREKEREWDTENERDEGDEEKRDAQVRDIMDGVERVICSMFYDRLFLPVTADDASHDEALSSRIAAVNLLDLGLAHLGVDVGKAGAEVEAVVRACGQTLVQLDQACRAPADKAAILVAAHKIIVDGLSRLPPIRLKSEDEILDDNTPRASSFGKQSADEDEDDEDEMKKVQSGSAATIVELKEPALLSPTIILPPDEVPSDTHALSLHTDDISPALPNRNNLLPADASSAPDRSRSSELTLSRPSSPTPVSGDIILPLMIFAVVKANPPRLVSNLLYIQRFRREGAGGGEEGYCLINLMAVAEFLENVDLAALGLGESEKNVISAAALSPIPVTRSGLISGSQPSSPLAVNPSLRGRVEQQVDAIAGSANKVISGVVDTSFGVLRMLLPGQSQAQKTPAEPQLDTDAPPAEESVPARPGFTLLRRDTGFSIASLAASLPGAASRVRSTGQNEEAGQQMVEVPSRPGSSRSIRGQDERSTSEESSSEDEEESEDEEGEHDTRSIRSFESMMSGRHRQRKRAPGGRKSITDRLASVPGLSRLSQSAPHEVTKGSPPGSRKSSVLFPKSAASNRLESPESSRAPSPIAIRISPPNSRFLSCTEDDIKVSEVGELLREYRRLAEAVRMMGGFHDD
ncbi:hypothetical protein BKA93DRAFT_895417 [Sparassis latifolia]